MEATNAGTFHDNKSCHNFWSLICPYWIFLPGWCATVRGREESSCEFRDAIRPCSCHSFIPVHSRLHSRERKALAWSGARSASTGRGGGCDFAGSAGGRGRASSPLAGAGRPGFRVVGPAGGRGGESGLEAALAPGVERGGGESLAPSFG